MQVLRHYDDVPDELRRSVVAIGNFDGIHRGHQEVIGKAGRLARELGGPQTVLTFEPHPRSFFAPDAPPFRLTPFRTKARLIEALGVDLLVALHFDEELSRLSAESFAREVLGEGLGVRHVVVGDNFHFGHKRQGDIALLQGIGRECGFDVSAIGRIRGPGGDPYSSSLIREYLAQGNPTRAALLLGRYFEIEGRIQEGERLGRDLGYPTANIAQGDMLLPAFGVYAVRAAIDHGTEVVWHAGVASLGVRPTVGGKTPLLEVHLFDFDDDIYGHHLRVALVDFQRPEVKFDSLEAMKVQMKEDERRARMTLAWEDWDASWPASPFMAVPIDLGS
jgi:riboflavin kinase/FMN adenylyltransferase